MAKALTIRQARIYRVVFLLLSTFDLVLGAVFFAYLGGDICVYFLVGLSLPSFVGVFWLDRSIRLKLERSHRDQLNTATTSVPTEAPQSGTTDEVRHQLVQLGSKDKTNFSLPRSLNAQAIRINLADFKKLITLPGIGAAEAQMIIGRRGILASSLDELVEHIKIPPHIAERLRDLVEFSHGAGVQIENGYQIKLALPQPTVPNDGARIVD